MCVIPTSTNWSDIRRKKTSLLRELFPFLGQGLFFPVMRADLLVNFTKWKKPEQMTQSSLLLFIIKRHNRTEQDCLLKTTAHTHTHTPNKPNYNILKTQEWIMYLIQSWPNPKGSALASRAQHNHNVAASLHPPHCYYQIYLRVRDFV